MAPKRKHDTNFAPRARLPNDSAGGRIARAKCPMRVVTGLRMNQSRLEFFPSHLHTITFCVTMADEEEGPAVPEQPSVEESGGNRRRLPSGVDSFRGQNVFVSEIDQTSEVVRTVSRFLLLFLFYSLIFSSIN